MTSSLLGDYDVNGPSNDTLQLSHDGLSAIDSAEVDTVTSEPATINAFTADATTDGDLLGLAANKNQEINLQSAIVPDQDFSGANLPVENHQVTDLLGLSFDEAFSQPESQNSVPLEPEENQVSSSQDLLGLFDSPADNENTFGVSEGQTDLFVSFLNSDETVFNMESNDANNNGNLLTSQPPIDTANTLHDDMGLFDNITVGEIAIQDENEPKSTFEGHSLFDNGAPSVSSNSDIFGFDPIADSSTQALCNHQPMEQSPNDGMIPPGTANKPESTIDSQAALLDFVQFNHSSDVSVVHDLPAQLQNADNSMVNNLLGDLGLPEIDAMSLHADGGKPSVVESVETFPDSTDGNNDESFCARQNEEPFSDGLAADKDELMIATVGDANKETSPEDDETLSSDKINLEISDTNNHTVSSAQTENLFGETPVTQTNKFPEKEQQDFVASSLENIGKQGIAETTTNGVEYTQNELVLSEAENGGMPLTGDNNMILDTDMSADNKVLADIMGDNVPMLLDTDKTTGDKPAELQGDISDIQTNTDFGEQDNASSNVAPVLEELAILNNDGILKPFNDTNVADVICQGEYDLASFMSPNQESISNSPDEKHQNEIDRLLSDQILDVCVGNSVEQFFTIEEVESQYNSADKSDRLQEESLLDGVVAAGDIIDRSEISTPDSLDPCTTEPVMQVSVHAEKFNEEEHSELPHTTIDTQPSDVYKSTGLDKESLNENSITLVSINNSGIKVEGSCTLLEDIESNVHSANDANTKNTDQSTTDSTLAVDNDLLNSESINAQEIATPVGKDIESFDAFSEVISIIDGVTETTSLKENTEILLESASSTGDEDIIDSINLPVDDSKTQDSMDLLSTDSLQKNNAGLGAKESENYTAPPENLPLADDSWTIITDGEIPSLIDCVDSKPLKEHGEGSKDKSVDDPFTTVCTEDGEKIGDVPIVVFNNDGTVLKPAVDLSVNISQQEQSLPSGFLSTSGVNDVPEISTPVSVDLFIENQHVEHLGIPDAPTETKSLDLSETTGPEQLSLNENSVTLDTVQDSELNVDSNSNLCTLEAIESNVYSGNKENTENNDQFTMDLTFDGDADLPNSEITNPQEKATPVENDMESLVVFSEQSISLIDGVSETASLKEETKESLQETASLTGDKDRIDSFNLPVDDSQDSMDLPSVGSLQKSDAGLDGKVTDTNTVPESLAYFGDSWAVLKDGDSAKSTNCTDSNLEDVHLEQQQDYGEGSKDKSVDDPFTTLSTEDGEKIGDVPIVVFNNDETVLIPAVDLSVNISQQEQFLHSGVVSTSAVNDVPEISTPVSVDLFIENQHEEHLGIPDAPNETKSLDLSETTGSEQLSLNENSITLDSVQDSEINIDSSSYYGTLEAVESNVYSGNKENAENNDQFTMDLTFDGDADLPNSEITNPQEESTPVEKDMETLVVFSEQSISLIDGVSETASLKEETKESLQETVSLTGDKDRIDSFNLPVDDSQDSMDLPSVGSLQKSDAGLDGKVTDTNTVPESLAYFGDSWAVLKDGDSAKSTNCTDSNLEDVHLEQQQDYGEGSKDKSVDDPFTTVSTEDGEKIGDVPIVVFNNDETVLIPAVDLSVNISQQEQFLHSGVVSTSAVNDVPEISTPVSVDLFIENQHEEHLGIPDAPTETKSLDLSETTGPEQLSLNENSITLDTVQDSELNVDSNSNLGTLEVIESNVYSGNKENTENDDQATMDLTFDGDADLPNSEITNPQEKATPVENDMESLVVFSEQSISLIDGVSETTSLKEETKESLQETASLTGDKDRIDSFNLPVDNSQDSMDLPSVGSLQKSDAGLDGKVTDTNTVPEILTPFGDSWTVLKDGDSATLINCTDSNLDAVHLEQQLDSGESSKDLKVDPFTYVSTEDGEKIEDVPIVVFNNAETVQAPVVDLSVNNGQQESLLVSVNPSSTVHDEPEVSTPDSLDTFTFDNHHEEHLEMLSSITTNTQEMAKPSEKGTEGLVEFSEQGISLIDGVSETSLKGETKESLQETVSLTGDKDGTNSFKLPIDDSENKDSTHEPSKELLRDIDAGPDAKEIENYTATQKLTSLDDSWTILKDGESSSFIISADSKLEDVHLEQQLDFEEGSNDVKADDPFTCSSTKDGEKMEDVHNALFNGDDAVLIPAVNLSLKDGQDTSDIPDLSCHKDEERVESKDDLPQFKSEVCNSKLQSEYEGTPPVTLPNTLQVNSLLNVDVFSSNTNDEKQQINELTNDSTQLNSSSSYQETDAIRNHNILIGDKQELKGATNIPTAISAEFEELGLKTSENLLQIETGLSIEEGPDLFNNSETDIVDSNRESDCPNVSLKESVVESDKPGLLTEATKEVDLLVHGEPEPESKLNIYENDISTKVIENQETGIGIPNEKDSTLLSEKDLTDATDNREQQEMQVSSKIQDENLNSNRIDLLQPTENFESTLVDMQSISQHASVEPTTLISSSQDDYSDTTPHKNFFDDVPCENEIMVENVEVATNQSVTTAKDFLKDNKSLLNTSDQKANSLLIESVSTNDAPENRATVISDQNVNFQSKPQQDLTAVEKVQKSDTVETEPNLFQEEPTLLIPGQNHGHENSYDKVTTQNGNDMAEVRNKSLLSPTTEAIMISSSLTAPTSATGLILPQSTDDILKNEHQGRTLDVSVTEVDKTLLLKEDLSLDENTLNNGVVNEQQEVFNKFEPTNEDKTDNVVNKERSKSPCSSTSSADSLFGSDHMNISDLDSEPDGAIPADNVSQISLEFDDNMFQTPPKPPPREKKKVLASIAYTKASSATNTTNVVPSTVFFDMDDISNAEFKGSVDEIQSPPVTRVITPAITAPTQVLSFQFQSNSGEQTTDLDAFDSDWEEIQQQGPSISTLPVIEEEPEPEDDDWKTTEVSEKNESEDSSDENSLTLEQSSEDDDSASQDPKCGYDQIKAVENIEPVGKSVLQLPDIDYPQDEEIISHKTVDIKTTVSGIEQREFESVHEHSLEKSDENPSKTLDVECQEENREVLPIVSETSTKLETEDMPCDANLIINNSDKTTDIILVQTEFFKENHVSDSKDAETDSLSPENDNSITQVSHEASADVVTEIPVKETTEQVLSNESVENLFTQLPVKATETMEDQESINLQKELDSVQKQGNTLLSTAAEINVELLDTPSQTMSDIHKHFKLVATQDSSSTDNGSDLTPKKLVAKSHSKETKAVPYLSSDENLTTDKESDNAGKEDGMIYSEIVEIKEEPFNLATNENDEYDNCTTGPSKEFQTSIPKAGDNVHVTSIVTDEGSMVEPESGSSNQEVVYSSKQTAKHLSEVGFVENQNDPELKQVKVLPVEDLDVNNTAELFDILDTMQKATGDFSKELPATVEEIHLEDKSEASIKQLKLLLQPEVTADTIEEEITTSRNRTRYDTIGSIEMLTDSEEDELEDDQQKPDTTSVDLISIDLNESGSETVQTNHALVRKRSIAPPSSLVLSVALGDIQVQTPVAEQPDDGTLEKNKENLVSSNQTEISEGKKETKPEQESSAEVCDSSQMETIVIDNKDIQIDGKTIQNYKRIISHGGFYKERCAIVEIFGRYLPDNNIPNYVATMDNLFLYLMATLEVLVQDREYVVVFFNNHMTKSQFPSTSWLRKSHAQVPRTLRKNLKEFYVIQSSFYFKTVANLTRMFLSRKVYKKTKSVKSHKDLKPFIPTEFLFVPDDISGMGSKSTNIESLKYSSGWHWWWTR